MITDEQKRIIQIIGNHAVSIKNVTNANIEPILNSLEKLIKTFDDKKE